ncbi:hypothetical protein PTTG_30173, partial [Puccinia triticina 1-1 BBBD Race 1]
VCPLATLSNWENEIRLHFTDQAITYQVFHGPERKHLTRQVLQSCLVVLTTYEKIGESRNMPDDKRVTIESLKLHWFRIVLDEAQTPVQNHLTDLQSLITMLKLAPWDNESIWQRCLIPKIKVGAPEAIKSLTRLMESVCLRRTKDVLLNLPSKVENAVVVRCSSKWEPHLRDLHARFICTFGRLRTSGEQWDHAEFFQQLTMLCQFCNRPSNICTHGAANPTNMAMAGFWKDHSLSRKSRSLVYTTATE